MQAAGARTDDRARDTSGVGAARGASGAYRAAFITPYTKTNTSTLTPNRKTLCCRTNSQTAGTL